ncbi:MAG: response regulator [Verrucomicrobiota bacterium]
MSEGEEEVVGSDLNYIVLVEDEKDMQMMAKMALVDVGKFKLDIFSSGNEAVEELPKLDPLPDLILLDFRMPGLDGVQTFAALEENMETVGIPIIFVTSNVKPHEIQTYYEIGAIGVIPKPFDPMSLAEMVRSIWWNMRGAAREENNMDELKGWYQETLPSRITALEDHLRQYKTGANPDSQECVLRQIAHLLRGSGATYGFPEISRAASALEDVDSSGVEEKTAALVDTLKKFAVAES